MGVLRSMRRSNPSAIDHSWMQLSSQSDQDAPVSVRASWPQNFAAAASNSNGLAVGATPPRLPSGGSRHKNTSRRRVIDIGSWSGVPSGAGGAGSASGNRGQSCAAALTRQEDPPAAGGSNPLLERSGGVGEMLAAASQQEKKPPMRSASVPPATTATANPEEKARAVAALQKLFFEEMKSGGDANGAAARALRRLSELQAGRSPSCAPSPCPSPMPKTAAFPPPFVAVRPRPPAMMEIDAEAPSPPLKASSAIPRRPSPVIGGGRRRPSPMVRVRS